jgi:ribosomal peptide maturation radical SAM protein 1
MIYLLNMPFASLINPNLALSQFKAQLSQAGLGCRLLNLNFDFASEIGIKSYEAFARRRGVDTQIGEWFFAKNAWDGAVDLAPESFIGLCGVNPAYFANKKQPLAWLQRVRDEIVPRFIEKSCDRLFREGTPSVVAFSCTFYQTISSLALARAVKARSPSTRVVFGGACFHAGMGWELFRKVPWIDAVSLGEADDIVVDLFKKLADGQPPAGLQGICYRTSDGAVVQGPPHRPVSAAVLESVPDPDFDDFMGDLKSGGLVNHPKAIERVFLPFESSRGCWWGEKRQCVFCGLNAEGMTYRRKSAARMRRQFENYLERYSVRRFFATDNNMPRQYLKDLFPDLIRTPLKSRPLFFYEIKTNVTREEMRIMSGAGVSYTQPGIESLSTALLKHMRKGITALQNLHYLKLCRTFFIFPMWNFLVSVPGERIEDYREQAGLIPKIVHFNPPYAGVRLMQLHRFSPYFDKKDAYVSGVKPRAWYAGLFPKETIDIDEVAYYFDADWQRVVGRTEEDYTLILHPIQKWVDAWKNEPELPGLSYHVLDMGGLDLLDTRFGKNGIWRLSAAEARVYRAIDDPVSLEALQASLGGGTHSASRLKGMLEEFVKHDIAVEESGRYLGLALPDTSPSLSLDYRKLFLPQEEKLTKDLKE